MKSNDELRALPERYDPFPVEMALSTCSLLVSLVGAFWSWKGVRGRGEEKGELDFLIDSVVELKGTIAEVAILIGTCSEELADDVLRFKKGDVQLDGFHFVKYRRVEKKITGLIEKVRSFSLAVRRHSIKSDSLIEQDVYEEKFLLKVDEMIENIGNWTFAELCKSMRDSCGELERLLARAYEGAE